MVGVIIRLTSLLTKSITETSCALTISAGFTYRLDRLKPKASECRGPPVKVYNILTLLLDFHTYAVITYCTF
jgi:hypothetical protein